jgi:hypothetical protein
VGLKDDNLHFPTTFICLLFPSLLCYISCKEGHADDVVKATKSRSVFVISHSGLEILARSVFDVWSLDKTATAVVLVGWLVWARMFGCGIIGRRARHPDYVRGGCICVKVCVYVF